MSDLRDALPGQERPDDEHDGSPIEPPAPTDRGDEHAERRAGGESGDDGLHVERRERQRRKRRRESGDAERHSASSKIRRELTDSSMNVKADDAVPAPSATAHIQYTPIDAIAQQAGGIASFPPNQYRPLEREAGSGHPLLGLPVGVFYDERARRYSMYDEAKQKYVLLDASFLLSDTPYEGAYQTTWPRRRHRKKETAAETLARENRMRETQNARLARAALKLQKAQARHVSRFARRLPDASLLSQAERMTLLASQPETLAQMQLQMQLQYEQMQAAQADAAAHGLPPPPPPATLPSRVILEGPVPPVAPGVLTILAARAQATQGQGAQGKQGPTRPARGASQAARGKGRASAGTSASELKAKARLAQDESKRSASPAGSGPGSSSSPASSNSRSRSVPANVTSFPYVHPVLAPIVRRRKQRALDLQRQRKRAEQAKLKSSRQKKRRRQRSSGDGSGSEQVSLSLADESIDIITPESTAASTSGEPSAAWLSQAAAEAAERLASIDSSLLAYDLAHGMTHEQRRMHVSNALGTKVAFPFRDVESCELLFYAVHPEFVNRTYTDDEPLVLRLVQASMPIVFEKREVMLQQHRERQQQQQREQYEQHAQHAQHMQDQEQSQANQAQSLALHPAVAHAHLQSQSSVLPEHQQLVNARGVLARSALLTRTPNGYRSVLDPDVRLATYQAPPGVGLALARMLATGACNRRVTTVPAAARSKGATLSARGAITSSATLFHQAYALLGLPPRAPRIPIIYPPLKDDELARGQLDPIAVDLQYADIDWPKLNLFGCAIDGVRVNAAINRSRGPHPEIVDLFYWQAQRGRSSLFNGWFTVVEAYELVLSYCRGERRAPSRGERATSGAADSGTTGAAGAAGATTSDGSHGPPGHASGDDAAVGAAIVPLSPADRTRRGLIAYMSLAEDDPRAVRHRTQLNEFQTHQQNMLQIQRYLVAQQQVAERQIAGLAAAHGAPPPPLLGDKLGSLANLLDKRLSATSNEARLASGSPRAPSETGARMPTDDGACASGSASSCQVMDAQPELVHASSAELQAAEQVGQAPQADVQSAQVLEPVPEPPMSEQQEAETLPAGQQATADEAAAPMDGDA